jgi:glucokinase
VLAALDEPTAADVAAAARAGDALAAEVWDATTTALACGVTSIVNLFEPEAVVLGGGVTRSGEQLLAPVRETVRTSAMGPAGRGATVVLSALGDRAGVVGAAAIAFDRLGTGRASG